MDSTMWATFFAGLRASMFHVVPALPLFAQISAAPLGTGWIRTSDNTWWLKLAPGGVPVRIDNGGDANFPNPNVIWVSGTAPAGGNGTVGDPYITIQDAIDAAPAASSTIIMIGPDDYVENLAFNSGTRKIALCGLGAFTLTGTIDWNINGNGAGLWIGGIGDGSAEGGAGALATRPIISGTITITEGVGAPYLLGSFGGTFRSTFGVGISGAAITTPLDVVLKDTSFVGTCDIASGGLVADDTDFGDLVTMLGIARASSCTFQNGITVTGAVAGSIGLVNCSYTGLFTGPDASIRFDAATYQSFLENVGTVAGATMDFRAAVPQPANVLWVIGAPDGNITISVGAQTGTITSPFSTIQAAIDAAMLLADTDVVIKVAPGAYGEALAFTFAGTKRIVVEALGQVAINGGAWTVDFAGGAPAAGSSLWFGGIADDSAEAALLSADTGITITGALGLSVAAGTVNCSFGGTFRLVGAIAPAGGLINEALNVVLRYASFSAAANFVGVAPAQGGDVVADHCEFTGLLTTNSIVRASECTFGGGATVAAVGGGLLNCNFTNAYTGIAGSLILDGATYQSMVANGATIVGATIDFVDGTPQPTNVLWVSVTTGLNTPSATALVADGTMERPFATIQAAIDAAMLLAGADVVIKVAPGTYAEALTFTYALTHRIIVEALGQVAITGNMTVAFSGAGAGAINSSLWIGGIADDNAEAAPLSADTGITITSDTVINVLALNTGCSFGGTFRHVGTILPTGGINEPLNVALRYASFSGASSFAGIGAADGGDVVADHCEFTGLLTANSIVRASECTFGGGATVAAVGGGLLNCNFTNAYTGIAGSLILDGATYQSMVANGATIVGATIDFVDGTPQPTNVLWVSVTTGLNTPSGAALVADGTMERPFATIQAAIDAAMLLAGADVVIKVAPGTYAEALTFTYALTHRIIVEALGQVAITGNMTVAFSGAGAGAINSSLWIGGIADDNAEAAPLPVDTGITITSDTVINVLALNTGCSFGGTFRHVGTILPTGGINEPLNVALRYASFSGASSFAGVVPATQGGVVRADHCVFTGLLTCSSISRASACVFTGGATVAAVDGTGGLGMVDCYFGPAGVSYTGVAGSGIMDGYTHYNFSRTTTPAILDGGATIVLREGYLDARSGVTPGWAVVGPDATPTNVQDAIYRLATALSTLLVNPIP